MDFDNEHDQSYDFTNSRVNKMRKSSAKGRKTYDPFEGTKFKVVLVGDQGVGKSWLINRFIKGDEFDPEDLNGGAERRTSKSSKKRD